MIATMSGKTDQRGEQQTTQRRDELLRRLLNTPPQPRPKRERGKGKSTRSRGKRASGKKPCGAYYTLRPSPGPSEQTNCYAVPRVSVCTIDSLTKPRTPKQKARAFLRWRAKRESE